MGKTHPESVVCFPFKNEDAKVFIKNIKEALEHPRVAEVICVGYEKDECYKAVESAVPFLQKEKGKRVHLILQKKLGEKRSGKGDAMNTALTFFINQTPYGRIHFYDADIVTFNREWITKTEEKLDQNFQVARCSFPKAPTDGMITWNITRCGFAYNWPETFLPEIEQPLGGELAFRREIAQELIKDRWVLKYSDWGIDTAYMLAFCQYKAPIYEVYIRNGKLHKLYGQLTDLYTMLVECFTIIQENQSVKIDTNGILYHKDSIDIASVPQEIQHKKAFDVEGTVSLLRENWSPQEKELLDTFPAKIREGMLALQKSGTVDVRFMDPETWYEVYGVLLRYFDQKSLIWSDLLFHLWVARVLNHTFYFASKGFRQAMESLYRMVTSFEHRRRKGPLIRGQIAA
ncbi:MAG: hypothetical protein JSW12_02520 [Deltaproteobacteria bacterium]|nr:MAG: hypothetical protein JSW12_02520 [Deltaproteobacteria bacterium]